MTSIKLIISGAQARAEVNGVLTSGMVGIPVTVEYDDAWHGLTKTLVCRSGNRYDPPAKGITRIVADIGTTAAVAHEVMVADSYLYLGIEGYNADGSLVMPTTWAECGKIFPGAHADAKPADPAPPVWARLEADITKLKHNIVTEKQVVTVVENYLEENPGNAAVAVLYTAQELTDRQKVQARANIGAASEDDSIVFGTLDADINVGAVLYRPAYGAGAQLCYYWQSGYTQACINPFAFYMKKGATYKAGLRNYSNYSMTFQVYRPSLAGVDFSYTPNHVMVFFPGEYERIVNSELLLSDYSYTPDEDGLIMHILFARVDNGPITEADLTALKSLFTLEYTSHESRHVSANMGTDNANRYLVTDGKGNVIPGPSTIVESEVPAYWTAYLEAKLPAIREKIVAGGAGTDAFMYFTDHHIGCKDFRNNANNTGHIIDFVRKYTPIRNVFFGGDILSTTADQTHDHVMNWLWAFHDDYIRRGVYPVIGDHEISAQYDTDGNHICFDEAYSILFRDAEKTADTGRKLYYFVDNPSQKIRCIVLDTESETISGNTAQLQWFIGTLESMGDGWTAVMLAHNFSEVTAYDNPDNPIITQIAGDYNNRTSGSTDNVSWDFSSASGTVACLICGHRHLDGSGVNNGILVINVTTDCGANADHASNDNAAGGNRTAGDVSEQAVELFFINTADRTIETIRLGYGEDRAWTYDSASASAVD